MPNLHLLGQALRLRWFWYHKTEPTRPAASTPCPDEECLHQFFKASVLTTLGNGTQVLFWQDPWLQDRSIVDLAPALVQAVDKNTFKYCTVAAAVHNRNWLSHITGALTVPVLHDYIRMRHLVDQVQLSDLLDMFAWRWIWAGQYSSQSAYSALHLGQTALAGAKELWKTRAPNKSRFFIWLVLHGKCWTSDRLQRHGLQNHRPCALCSQEVETADHLLTSCVYSREIWYRLLRSLGWQMLTPTRTDNTIDWWLRSRKRLGKDERRSFDTIFLLVSWLLWLERNARVFRGTKRTPARLGVEIVDELRQWHHAGLLPRAGQEVVAIT